MKNSEQALIDAIGDIAAALRKQQPATMECKTMPMQMQIAMHLLASSIQGKGVEILFDINEEHVDQALELGQYIVNSERRNDQD